MSTPATPDTLVTLINRNSSPALNGARPRCPAIGADFALRYASTRPRPLAPRRFVVIAGDRREALGGCFQESLYLRGVTDEAQLAKALAAPMRAPMIIAGLLHAAGTKKSRVTSKGMPLRLHSMRHSWQPMRRVSGVCGERGATPPIPMSLRPWAARLMIK